MNGWASRFDYPAQGWLQLVISDPDGAERAAQEVAGREGERMEEYAEAVYPELKAIWEGMREQQAAPATVYVPPVPLSTPPLVPISAYVQGQRVSPKERSLEVIRDLLSQPTPYALSETEVTVVELPAGPACRVHEVARIDEGDDGRRFVVEHVDYYVLPLGCPQGLFKLSVNWASLAIGSEMIATADMMAASLTVWRERHPTQAGLRPVTELDEGAER